MSNYSIPQQEQRQKIEAVIHYILKDPNSDVSLKKLSSIANYSPFHFQKLFTEIMGVSPKQYIIRIRIETACHYLVIQPNRSILEISLDTGFSSPSVFSRAFKNYFDISAEQMRAMPQDERIRFLYSKGTLLKHLPYANVSNNEELAVTIKRQTALSGICINTTYDTEEVQRSLRDVVKLAAAHDLLLPGTKAMGIIIPHHNIYRAFIPVASSVAIPKELNKVEIKAGKYASFNVSGTLKEVMEKVSAYFFKVWLPEHGYRIADIFGYEIFSKDPAMYDYPTIEREICVPIEPA
jgi:AraC family transcriptional regulator